MSLSYMNRTVLPRIVNGQKSSASPLNRAITCVSASSWKKVSDAFSGSR